MVDRRGKQITLVIPNKLLVKVTYLTINTKTYVRGAVLQFKKKKDSQWSLFCDLKTFSGVKPGFALCCGFVVVRQRRPAAALGTATII